MLQTSSQIQSLHNLITFPVKLIWTWKTLRQRPSYSCLSGKPLLAAVPGLEPSEGEEQSGPGQVYTGPPHSCKHSGWRLAWRQSGSRDGPSGGPVCIGFPLLGQLPVHTCCQVVTESERADGSWRLSQAQGQQLTVAASWRGAVSVQAKFGSSFSSRSSEPTGMKVAVGGEQEKGSLPRGRQGGRPPES